MDEIEPLLESSLKADDKSLYYMIGKSDLDGQIGVSPPSFDELVRRGKKLFVELDGKIRSIICTKEFADKISGIENDNRKKMALAVAEAIAALNGLPFAIFASVIIVRTGYLEYCGLEE